MACPFFEPAKPTGKPTHQGARLPLIREYEGWCHASGAPVIVDQDIRFRCNLGYSKGECKCFPQEETISGMRFSVRREHQGVLHVLCVEECDHAPVRWYEVQMEVASGEMTGEASKLVLAQAKAFGRSYLSADVTPAP